MKSQLSWNDSRNLNIPTHQSFQTKQRRFSYKLNDVWQHVLTHFYVSSEPRIWQTEDSLGRTAWSAYDPTTKRSIEQVSAPELRIWLEERYYQSV